MGIEQIWGKGDHFVYVEAELPVVIWADMSRKINMRVGSMREKD